MSTRLAIATGLFTAAATWAIADAASNSEVDSEAGSTASTTSNVPTNAAAGTTFTPGIITVDGVAVKISSKTSGGTFTITLHNQTTNADVTSTTVDVADLPANGWVFIKWSASQTLAAATAYQILMKTSTAGTVTLFRDGTTANWCRINRTTTTGAPGANDKLLVIGEHTGSGTGNSFTVTMDNTATTSFGPTVSGGPPQGIHVGKRGTWTNDTGALNYYFKWKGIFAVWDGGTLNIGTSGTPIPSNATAVYEMDSAANVDTGFDFKAGSTVNIYGTKAFTSSPSNHFSLLTVDRGGYCTTNGTAVTAVTSQSQSFTGLTGTIVINGVSYTISSVTDSTHLTLSTSAGVQASPVAWTHAGTGTVLTVGDTTGWAANDVVCIGATDRTHTHCESKTISTVDSSTQITLTTALSFVHQGNSSIGIQGEVGNLTRNVKLRGISTSLQGYINLSGTSVVFTARYAEFYQLGSATASKRGIDVQITSAGTFDVQYCSFHDGIVTNSGPMIFTSPNGTVSATISHNVFYNQSASHISINSDTSGVLTINDNVFMLCTNSAVLNLADIGSTITNNRVIGAATSCGILLAQAAVLGTFSGNVVHSCNGFGIQFTLFSLGPSLGSLCTIESCSTFRNVSTGLVLFNKNTLINNFSSLGDNNGIGFNGSSFNLTFSNCTINGDTVFSTARGLTLSGLETANLSLINCSLGVASGAKSTHNTADIDLAGKSTTQVTLLSCSLGSTTQVNSQTSMGPGGYVAAQRLGGTAGNHKVWMAEGTVTYDTVIFRTATPSLRATPNSASIKCPSSPTGKGLLKQVANGATCTASVYVRKSRSTDTGGANYTGNQPRLIVRANVCAGISTDTVLATMTTANPPTGADVWELLSGTTAAVTDDAVLEFAVDCDGTAGWINVDDFS